MRNLAMPNEVPLEVPLGGGIMAHTVRLSDLQALSPAERQEVLDRLAADAVGPANGVAAAAVAKIREYERRYEMTTAILLERLGKREIRETAEIAEWLFWVNVQRGAGGEKARPK